MRSSQRDERILARLARGGDRQAHDEPITMYLPAARPLVLRYRRQAERIDWEFEPGELRRSRP
jgi:hypothetical protein